MAECIRLYGGRPIIVLYILIIAKFNLTSVEILGYRIPSVYM
jgi:hypothetical protein